MRTEGIVIDLHPDVVAVSAFRVLPNGEGRAYCISEAPGGRAAIERVLRMVSGLGSVGDAGEEDSYAVLDILDRDDSIVQDFTVPSATAFPLVEAAAAPASPSLLMRDGKAPLAAEEAGRGLD